MSYSKGIFWLDDCRIPYVNEKDKDKNTDGLERFIEHRKKRNDLGYGFDGGKSYEINNTGRFTPSLLVCDDLLNDGNITLSQGGNSTNIGGFVTAYADESKRGVKSGFGDKGTNSRYYDLDLWFDKMLERL